MQIAIGILLIIAAVFLVVAVLMQSGKSHNLSGTIAGGAETFFGKAKGSTIDKKLSKLTTIVAIVFVVLVLVSYLMQDTVDLSSLNQTIIADDHDHDHDHEVSEVVEDEAAEEETEAAAEETEAEDVNG
ncbi:MAG: preprotein translocase subunit SecG [Clostridia bacterium]|nr:preprotein translocase subunit SecG [Clostridia bacterium]